MNDVPSNSETTSDLPQSVSRNSRITGRVPGISFRLIAWSCLVALEVYYLVVVLVPFFTLGVYKMSRRDMFYDPNLTFPDPALLWPCLLFQCGVIPLLIFAIIDTVLTRRTSSRRAHLLRLSIVGFTVLIIVVSYVNGDNLFSWGASFEPFYLGQ